MTVEAGVRPCDQRAVEALFASACLVTCDEDQGAPLCVESKGRAPDAVGGVEAQLLHVAMFRTLQRVHMRAAELWSEGFKQTGLGEQRRLDFVRKR